MKSIKLAAAVALCAVLSTAAYADQVQPFSAVAGVEAQALSPSEMNDVYGQLTIAEIDAAIMAKVTNPFLQSYLIAQVAKFAAMYPNQTAYILAVLTRYGL
jgi:hypothetical protein